MARVDLVHEAVQQVVPKVHAGSGGKHRLEEANPVLVAPCSLQDGQESSEPCVLAGGLASLEPVGGFVDRQDDVPDQAFDLGGGDVAGCFNVALKVTVERPGERRRDWRSHVSGFAQEGGQIVGWNRVPLGADAIEDLGYEGTQDLELAELASDETEFGLVLVGGGSEARQSVGTKQGCWQRCCKRRDLYHFLDVGS